LGRKEIVSFLDEYDRYIEELFQAQFDISEKLISHRLERGQTREDFIKDEIKRRFQRVNIQRGFVAGSAKQASNQTDVLILRQNAQTRMLGSNCLANVDDVDMVIEIKSTANGVDLRKFNDDIALIKQQNNNRRMPLFGMFCYRLNLKKKTVFQRFGFDYDEVNDLLRLQDQEKANLRFDYPNIDFVLSIDRSDLGNKRFLYLQKTQDRDNKPYYVSLVELPITKHLWNTIQGRM
jgi:hypothetical protein